MDEKDKNIDLGDLYRDVVLDHYREPRKRTPLKVIDMKGEGYNPVCGDEISMQLKMDGDKVDDVHVDCKGCAISVASASMLAELLPGMTEDQIEKLTTAFRSMMQGKPAPEDLEMGDLDALEGVSKFPVRVKCALLAWYTLLEAMKNGKNGDGPSDPVTTEE